jgi:hypothetical protein
MKIRVEGTREEIDWFVLGLKKIYDVREVSKPYANRDGKNFRVYVELFPFFVRSGSPQDAKNLSDGGDGVEASPRPYDAVMGSIPEATDASNETDDAKPQISPSERPELERETPMPPNAVYP